MNNDNDENHIIQNLKDAGCDHDTITAFGNTQTNTSG